MFKKLMGSRKFVGGIVTVIVGVVFAAAGDKLKDGGFTPEQMETMLIGIFTMGGIFTGGTALEDAAAKRGLEPKGDK